MKGVFINCPNKDCRKMLMKNAYLRPGSFLTIKCFHCGIAVELNSQVGTIELRVVKQVEDKPVDNANLTEDDDDDTIFLSM